MKKLLLIFLPLLFGCGEQQSDKHGRWMTELDCPVILISKTGKAVNYPCITVRDGNGRVRTFETYNDNSVSHFPSSVADSREIGDTLKPCN